MTTTAAMKMPRVQIPSLTSVSIRFFRLLRISVRPTTASEMRTANRATIHVIRMMKNAIARLGSASTKPLPMVCNCVRSVAI